MSNKFPYDGRIANQTLHPVQSGDRGPSNWRTQQHDKEKASGNAIAGPMPHTRVMDADVQRRFGVAIPRNRNKRFAPKDGEPDLAARKKENQEMRDRIAGNRISPNTLRLQWDTMMKYRDWAEYNLPDVAVDSYLPTVDELSDWIIAMFDELPSPRGAQSIARENDDRENDGRENDLDSPGDGVAIPTERVQEMLDVVDGRQAKDSRDRRWVQCYQTIKAHLKRIEIWIRRLPAFKDKSKDDQLAYWQTMDAFFADPRATYPRWCDSRKSRDSILPEANSILPSSHAKVSARAFRELSNPQGRQSSTPYGTEWEFGKSYLRKIHTAEPAMEPLVLPAASVLLTGMSTDIGDTSRSGVGLAPAQPAGSSTDIGDPSLRFLLLLLRN
ncbi:hypothetical protein HDU89_003260 [Geranomyces variabilis]|nr:hypothetical protein HDU89_003260 [Geranomyces variabilis]